MKQTLIAVALLFTLLACKKSTEPIKEEKRDVYTVRVQAAGSEIYYSNVAYYANGNGGQANENNYGKIEYLGYSGGYYMVKVTNKQSCNVDFDLKWLNKDTTVLITGSGDQLIYLPGPASGGQKIKAKPLYRCGNSGGDLGQIETETPLALPIKFKSIRTEKIGKDKLKIIFDVDECEGVNTFNVQLQKNWGEFKTVAVIFPDDTQPNREYSVTISL